MQARQKEGTGVSCVLLKLSTTAFFTGDFGCPKSIIWQTRRITEDIESIVPADGDRSYASRPSLADMYGTMPALYEEPELCAPDYDEDAEVNEEDVEWYEATMEAKFGKDA